MVAGAVERGDVGRRPTARQLGVAALVALAGSLIALAVAPTLMPASYDWVAHTTSESAAQGVAGAWLARTGFVAFGGGALLLAGAAWSGWGKVGSVLHVTFGLMMVAAAAFSARPWDPALPFDQLEDLFHSVAATAMGFAFAFGVLAVALRRPKGAARWGDLVPIVASVVLPLSMVVAGDLAGLLQRVMFLIAYAWYGAAAIALLRGHSTSGRPPAA